MKQYKDCDYSGCIVAGAEVMTAPAIYLKKNSFYSVTCQSTRQSFIIFSKNSSFFSAIP